MIDRGNSTHETPVYLNVTLREVNADGKESKWPRTGSGVYCCGRRVGRSDSDLLYGFRAGNGSPTSRDYDGYSRVGGESRSKRGADGSAVAAATDHHLGDRRAAGDGDDVG